MFLEQEVISLVLFALEMTFAFVEKAGLAFTKRP